MKEEWIATVLIESSKNYSNKERMQVLIQILNNVTKNISGDGVILFPGGLFSSDEKEARTLYNWIERRVKDILNKLGSNIIICLGIDGRINEYTKDQIGIAINKNGIEAIGRKFHPTYLERENIDCAPDYLTNEDGKHRVFELNGRKYFICVCYDVFGINHMNIPNKLNIGVILNCIHQFCPPGEGPSGAYYFARDGFARASKQWECPVFGAAVFFSRKVSYWPSGVYQTSEVKMNWRYSDNSLNYLKEFRLEVPEGFVLIRIYK